MPLNDILLSSTLNTTKEEVGIFQKVLLFPPPFDLIAEQQKKMQQMQLLQTFAQVFHNFIIPHTLYPLVVGSRATLVLFMELL